MFEIRNPKNVRKKELPGKSWKKSNRTMLTIDKKCFNPKPSSRNCWRWSPWRSTLLGGSSHGCKWLLTPKLRILPTLCPGVRILPTQTMHYSKGIPSKWPIKFHPPKNGSHLMIPRLTLLPLVLERKLETSIFFNWASNWAMRLLTVFSWPKL